MRLSEVLGCVGKARHPSRRVAVRTLRVQLARWCERHGGPRPTLGVYPCGHCRWWHVGGNVPAIAGQPKREGVA